MLFAFIWAASTLFAQLSSEKISYQAIIRRSDGQPITNQGVGIQLSILQGLDNSTEVYVETQSSVSDANGLVSLEIGAGNILKGSLSEVDWSYGNLYIKMDIDPSAAGGTNYSISGSSQLVSVPFAFHAKTAEGLVGGLDESDPLFDTWDKSSGIIITESQISDLGNYIESETDPVFKAWNKSTGIVVAESQVTDLGNYIETETDPIFGAWNKSEGITITESQVADLGNYIENETDSFFAQTAAYGISNVGSGEVITIAERQKLDGIEQGAQQNVKSDWNANSGDAEIVNKPVDLSAFTNDAGLIAPPENPSTGDILYCNGTGWAVLPKGMSGQLLAINADGEIVWGNAPMVTTIEPLNTVNQTAILAGLVNANGLKTEATFEYGTTTSYGNTIEASLSPIEGSTEIEVRASLSGLTVGETYHYRVKASNVLSTILGHDMSFTVTTLSIGDDYGGGKVAYIFQPGDNGYIEGETHGIIVSPNNATNSEWGCSGTSIGTSTAVGFGMENTLAITSICFPAPGTNQKIAAHECNNLVLNGYNDWYLPSSSELTQVYINRAVLGSFSNDYYWSSSQVNSVHAYYRHFGTGVLGTGGKGIVFKVRPVRSF